MDLETAPSDLADPALYAEGDAERVWRRLRREAPVHWNRRPDGAGFWAVTRYADILDVYQRPEVFVSRHGMALDADPVANAAAADKMLIVADGARHRQIRRIISRAFAPAMVRRLEENMRRTVAASVEAAMRTETVELTEFASRLPLTVICDLLGVPPADWDFMLDCTRTAFGHAAGAHGRAQMNAHAELLLYYAELVDFRRSHPSDDIVTALSQGVVDGRPLTDEEIFLNCNGLISGGNETTRHATVAGLLAFLRHPDQWARLRADRDLLDPAVQEVLRYSSPALHVLRTAVADATIGGVRVRAGDRVALWLPSGNRDDDVFPHGDDFDIGRPGRRNLTFGFGPHQCLGLALATTELRTLFAEVADRVESISPAGEPRRLRSNLIWGYDSAPVRWHGAPSASPG